MTLNESIKHQEKLVTELTQKVETLTKKTSLYEDILQYNQDVTSDIIKKTGQKQNFKVQNREIIVYIYY